MYVYVDIYYYVVYLNGFKFWHQLRHSPKYLVKIRDVPLFWGKYYSF